MNTKTFLLSVTLVAAALVCIIFQRDATGMSDYDLGAAASFARSAAPATRMSSSSFSSSSSSSSSFVPQQSSRCQRFGSRVFASSRGAQSQEVVGRRKFVENTGMAAAGMVFYYIHYVLTQLLLAWVMDEYSYVSLNWFNSTHV